MGSNGGLLAPPGKSIRSERAQFGQEYIDLKRGFQMNKVKRATAFDCFPDSINIEIESIFQQSGQGFRMAHFQISH